jgi:hypothetical protein
MPGTLTRTWLLAGGGMILGVVLLALLAPRPESLHVAGWKRLGSEDLQASKRSAGGSDAGKGPGQPQGDNRKDDPADKNGQGGQGQPKGDQKGDTKSQEKSAGQGSSNVQDQQSEKKNNAEPSSLGSQPPPTPPPPRPVLPTLTMPPVLRWLVFAVVLVIVVLAVAWYVMQLWEQQERSRMPTANEEPAESTPRERRWPPFSSYRNPFLSGERRPLPELVRYTFAAMESWAAERGHPRQPEETPGEFARRLQQATELGSAVALAGLLGRVEYGSGRLPANGHEAVRAFWDESG